MEIGNEDEWKAAVSDGLNRKDIVCRKEGVGAAGSGSRSGTQRWWQYYRKASLSGSFHYFNSHSWVDNDKVRLAGRTV